MISDKLKDFIFKKLYSDLSCVEIISYEDYIWFIDREKKYWYFRYCKSDGKLLWRYSFFEYFFRFFTIDNSEYTSVLSSWVEEVLNHKVITTSPAPLALIESVDNVLNHKVTATDCCKLFTKDEIIIYFY